MNIARWTLKWIKMAFTITSGAMLLGAGCANDVKKSLVSAGLDFIEDGAGAVLNGVIPIDDIVAALTGTAG
ncbi:MAG: hypothetical protein JXA69_18505 [Phycisphaerae bacterium]|nr:hypothetical protein [Phycisphaerae bacterium]